MPSLLKLVEQWLERMPFFDDVVLAGLGAKSESDRAEVSGDVTARFTARAFPTRDDKEDLLGKFDDMFFKTGAGDFSPASLRAALFIMLYRDEPLFRLPFALLNALDRDRRAARQISVIAICKWSGA